MAVLHCNIDHGVNQGSKSFATHFFKASSVYSTKSNTPWRLLVWLPKEACAFPGNPLLLADYLYTALLDMAVQRIGVGASVMLPHYPALTAANKVEPVTRIFIDKTPHGRPKGCWFPTFQNFRSQDEYIIFHQLAHFLPDIFLQQYSSFSLQHCVNPSSWVSKGVSRE
ncbi:hypothetical protein RvY_11844 [Ramazzottius varieornatus]|uniref:Uncharacterized protein n=1 Tax=Ramazzottius varieornatus TaxID=947166 RepID=A0A1D1VHE3_RAMVA|nr:hypothetical protein RvY_11844 [Ramazzottius varieornatus]